MGRKSKYQSEFAATLLDEMAKGLSFEACCGVLGVSKDTGYAWIKRYPEFAEAKAEGEAHGQAYWEGEAIKGIWGNKDIGYFNANVFALVMKNRFGWKEKKELSGSVGVIGDLYKDLTLTQIESKISEIISRLPKQNSRKS